jgi:hypothetical protein
MGDQNVLGITRTDHERATPASVSPNRPVPRFVGAGWQPGATRPTPPCAPMRREIIGAIDASACGGSPAPVARQETRGAASPTRRGTRPALCPARARNERGYGRRCHTNSCSLRAPLDCQRHLTSASTGRMREVWATVDVRRTSVATSLLVNAGTGQHRRVRSVDASGLCDRGAGLSTPLQEVRRQVS